MSVWVVPRPRDNRTAPSATSGVAPMPSRAAAGVSWPEWHADPVDAASPGAWPSTVRPTRRGKTPSACWADSPAGVADHARDRSPHLLPQVVAQTGQSDGFGGDVGADKVARSAEADDAGDVLGAGSDPVLLPAAEQQRL